MEETSARYPYLVWEEDGALLGYAYAHPYAARPAYQWSAELTVYLRQGVSRRGLGSQLYGGLDGAAEASGSPQCVWMRHRENTPASLSITPWAFGRPDGFSQVGYKLGRWLDVLWLEKAIASGGEPQPLVSFPQVDREQALAVLERWSKMK